MRQRFSRWLSFLTVVFMLSAICTTAQAALQAVGPTNPVDLYPTWYQDTTGLALEQCLDPPFTTGGIPYCTLLAAPGYNPALPIVFPSNYPVEDFYWIADALVDTTGGINSQVRVRFALEGTWALGVQTPGQQIVFLRIIMQKADNLPPNGTFTVTHPYGSFTFKTDVAGTTVKSTGGGGGGAFRVQDDATPIPLVYNTLLPAPTTHIGPFLRPSATSGGAPLPPIVVPVGLVNNSYLANPLIPTTVTGSPTGHNSVTITGTGIGGAGVNSVNQPLFFIGGKVAPPPGTPISVTSATYSRSATAGQVSVFATSTPTANLTVSGAGFPTTTMLHDALNPGNFFATIAATTPASLPGVPALVSVVNTLDAGLIPLPPPTTHVLVDGVTISTANYDPFKGILTVKAASSDTLAPLPTLTVPTLAAQPAPPALPVPGPALSATGLLNFAVAVPPASITVASSRGGSATSPVAIGVLAPPVAAADTATTVAGTAVTIPVLANDTPAATIDPASVAIATQSLNGTAVANPIGTVTFTPAVGFNGTTTFTYTVKDNLALVSLPATVTVTVTPPTIIPVAVNDTATTVVATAVTIPVLANDTINPPGVINPASVAIVIGSAVGGTPVVNATTGTVTFTPAAGFTGAASFSYTVKNTAVPPQTSNAGIVTVNVTAAPPPAAATAVNDVANTLVNVPRIINVVANDVGALPSTVVTVNDIGGAGLLAPTLGSIVNNHDGTVTYASATAGTDSFTYKVASTIGGVLSAPATVTVSVTSAITDAVTVLRAQYKTSTKEWLLEGNTTNVSPASKVVTIYVGNSLAGQILGTVATNPADGRWKFQLPGNPGNVPIDATKTVSVKLPSGASRLAFPVAVSP